MFVLQAVIMFGLLYHEPLQYQNYKYPMWAEWIGWSLALSSIMMIPIVAIIQLCHTPGSLKEVNFYIDISLTLIEFLKIMLCYLKGVFIVSLRLM